jgi:Flp pilus assembly protein TadG
MLSARAYPVTVMGTLSTSSSCSGPRRALRRLARDRRGVTAIEFGFIVTPLMALLIAILQIATTYFADQALETATEKGARLLMTGQSQKAAMTAASFKTAMCGALPSFMSCDNLMVDVTVVGDFGNAVTTAPTITYDSAGKPTNSWSFKVGNPGDIVVMRAMYVWGVQNGPLGFDITTMSNNRRLLMATSVLRVENY